jgi:DNA primase
MTGIDWAGIKARHRLADVVGRSGLSVRASGRVMISCPIPSHHDSAPSAQLDLDRDRYHCFGCGSRGDVIDWVRNIEGVDTAAAVAILESGRPINAVFASGTGRWTNSSGHEPPNPERTCISRVGEANQAAWEYYTQETYHEEAVAYLARRGLDLTTLEAETGAPTVGRSQPSTTRPDDLVSYLAGMGFTNTELIDAGLALRVTDRRVVDFFRNRLILAITDDAGVICGLLGRDMTGRSPVKYLNPPATAAYTKNETLYRPTRQPLGSDGAVVVCEGPLDALAIAACASTAGLSDRFTPVAACGTVLSDHQIETILSMHRRAPVLAGDGDQPGRQANLEWATRMLARGRESVITNWPEGNDPASWLAARGPDGLIALTRRGCLEDHSGTLRPRHCGAVLTETALHDRKRRPDRAELIRDVNSAAAQLPPAAKHRYKTAVASVFTVPIHTSTPPLPPASWCASPPDRPVERIEL